MVEKAKKVDAPAPVKEEVKAELPRYKTMDNDIKCRLQAAGINVIGMTVPDKKKGTMLFTMNCSEAKAKEILK